MNSVSNMLRAAIAAAVALGLLLAGALFAVSLFIVVLLLVAGGAVRALLAGRKPAPFVLWERWRDLQAKTGFSPNAVRARSGFGARSGRAADVVDVAARDLPATGEREGSQRR